MSAPVLDRYDEMLRLADHLDAAGADLRARARLGEQILHDEAVTGSGSLCRATWARAEDDLRAATGGRHGLLTRGLELDADALVLRATVLTYRWIDDLQETAFRTLGGIAARAIGYLAPEVTLGGAIVSAGLVEAGALDRGDVVGFLAEIAADNPELLEHITSGGGGLLDGLPVRAALTTPAMAGDARAAAARGGLRAIGVEPLATDVGSALRDVGAPLVEPDVVDAPPPDAASTDAPRGLEQLLRHLAEAHDPVVVQRVAPGRYIGYLPGPHRGTRRLRLVSGDHAAYVRDVVRAIEHAVDGDPGARVMLVGAGQGGVTAAEVAAGAASPAYTVDRVVTAGAPSAHVPALPATSRMLALEDRADPVALLGSLISAPADNRLTVVVEGTGTGPHAYVAAARAADAATAPEVRDELRLMVEAGYLAG